jgi:cell division protein FtsL
VATASRGALAEGQPRRGEQEAKPRPRLTAVAAERLREIARARRARAVMLLAASLVLGTLLVIAAAQAVVAAQQVRIDGLQQQLSTATTTNETLQVERANLTSPSRILRMAEHRLGMIAPTNIIYLPAVDPGPLAFNGTGTRSR